MKPLKLNQIELRKFIDDKKYTVLDLRTVVEYRDSHIEGTKNVPLNVCLKTLPAYRNQKIAVILNNLEASDINLIQNYCETLKITYQLLIVE